MSSFTCLIVNHVTRLAWGFVFQQKKTQLVDQIATTIKSVSASNFCSLRPRVDMSDSLTTPWGLDFSIVLLSRILDYFCGWNNLASTLIWKNLDDVRLISLITGPGNMVLFNIVVARMDSNVFGCLCTSLVFGPTT